MLMFRDLISSEYDGIRQVVRKKSFTFHINECDLLSAVNEKLSVSANNRDFEFAHKAQFWFYVNRTASSCALDMIRSNKGFIELTYQDCDSGIDLEVKSSALRIINSVLSGVKRPAHKEVFIAIVVDGEKYEAVSARLNVPLANVKTIVYQIRQRAQRKYGRVYLDAIA